MQIRSQNHQYKVLTKRHFPQLSTDAVKLLLDLSCYSEGHIPKNFVETHYEDLFNSTTRGEKVLQELFNKGLIKKNRFLTKGLLLDALAKKYG